MSLLDSNEPVRRSAVSAGVVVALSSLFGALALVGDLSDPRAWFGALAAALAQFAVIVFGVEVGRGQAYGPETVNGLIDAEAVITAAERRDHG